MPRRSVLSVVLAALLVSLLVLSADGASIALGIYHSCALSFAVTNSTMKCWGYNGHGQLGDGTTTDRTTPAEVSGITTATSIALGSYHSCALLGDGTVMCWGRNDYGQLGDGTTTDRLTPVEVSSITTASSIALGGYHSCALLTGGTMKCLGDNNHGQLGDGTTTDHGTGDGTPVEVSGLILAFPLPPCTCCQARFKKLGLNVDEECRLF